MDGSPVKINVIPIWQILILIMLSFYVIISVYASIKNVSGWIYIMAFAAPLFIGFLFSIAFSKIEIDKEGIRFRASHTSFNEINEIKLRWRGKLMTYGKKLDLGYILLNPQKFIEAVRAVGQYTLVDYGKQDT